MRKAVVAVDLPASWCRDIPLRHNAEVTILDCKPFPDGSGMQELFIIRAGPEKTEAIVKELRRNDRVSNLEVIMLSKGVMLGSLLNRSCSACFRFDRSPCFLTSVNSRANGTVEWTVVGKDTHMRTLFNELTEDNVAYKIVKLTGLNDEQEITSRQMNILRLAIEVGYFDFPRKTNLGRLASQVGVTPATLTEILRRAVKKVLTQYFALTYQ